MNTKTYRGMAEWLVGLGMAPEDKAGAALATFARWWPDANEKPKGEHRLISAMGEILEELGVAFSVHGEDVDFLEDDYPSLLEDAAACTGGLVTISDVTFIEGEGDLKYGRFDTLRFLRNGEPMSWELEHFADDYFDQGGFSENFGDLDPDVGPRRFYALLDGEACADDYYFFALPEQAEAIRDEFGVWVHGLDAEEGPEEDREEDPEHGEHLPSLPTPAELIAGDSVLTELTAAVPGLAWYARIAIRLNPQKGSPTVRDSSLGGPLLWPADEPWPVCTVPHLVEKRAGGSEEGTCSQVSEESPTEVPLVPVAQFYARDVPGMGWPEGVDLFQLLWCPNDHAEPPGQPGYRGPVFHLRLRRAAEVEDVLAEPPRPQMADDCYLPEPCLIEPEEAVDFPTWGEIPDELSQRAEVWARRVRKRYHRWLAALGGWKIGGWPSWHTTDFFPIDCDSCGARMELFLTMAGDDDPPGVVIGRHGELRIFICPDDNDHPIRLDIQ